MLTDRDAQHSCHTSLLCSFPSTSTEYVRSENAPQTRGVTTNRSTPRFPPPNMSHTRSRIRPGIMRFPEYVGAFFASSLYDNIFGVFRGRFPWRAAHSTVRREIRRGAQVVRGGGFQDGAIQQFVLGTLPENKAVRKQILHTGERHRRENSVDDARGNLTPNRSCAYTVRVPLPLKHTPKRRQDSALLFTQVAWI